MDPVYVEMKEGFLQGIKCSEKFCQHKANEGNGDAVLNEYCDFLEDLQDLVEQEFKDKREEP